MKLLLSLIVLLPFATSSCDTDTRSRKSIQDSFHDVVKRGPQKHPNPHYDYHGGAGNIDYTTPWISCPRRHLNCRKCPHDRRCGRPSHPSYPAPRSTSSTASTSTSTYSPKPEPTSNSSIIPVHTPLPRPHILPSMDPSEPAALTGPQLAHSNHEQDSDVENTTCELERCGSEPCGTGASCINGYCACASGFKGNGTGSMGRGCDVPESGSVWVDAGVECDTKCEGLFCQEVGGLEDCFGGAVGKNEVDTTNTAGHGATQIPGAGEIGEAA